MARGRPKIDVVADAASPVVQGAAPLRPDLREMMNRHANPGRAHFAIADCKIGLGFGQR